MSVIDGIIIFVISLLGILAVRSIVKNKGCNDCRHCHKKGCCKHG